MVAPGGSAALRCLVSEDEGLYGLVKARPHFVLVSGEHVRDNICDGYRYGRALGGLSARAGHNTTTRGDRRCNGTAGVNYRLIWEPDVTAADGLARRSTWPHP